MKIFGVLIIGFMMFFSCAGQRPENLGIQKEQLADCPDKPNCVSSQAQNETHSVPVFRYQGDKEAASRLGYSDFGVNQKRVEKLRKIFAVE